MFAALVCLACTHPTTGALGRPQTAGNLDTLRADIEAAWAKTKPSYHRFLSEAYGLVRRAMDDQDAVAVYKSMAAQGMKFEPELDVQKWIDTEPLFQADIGGAKHDVAVRWGTVRESSAAESSRYKISGAQVTMTYAPNCTVKDFLARMPYPKGTVVETVFQRPEFKKAIERSPIIESIQVSYRRGYPPMSSIMPPDQTYPFEFNVDVDLAEGTSEYATRHGSFFYVESGLDRPLLGDGKPAPGDFTPQDTLGHVTANIDSWSSTRSPSSSVAFRKKGIDVPPEPSGMARVYARGDLATLPDTTEEIMISGYEFEGAALPLLLRFKNLKRLLVMAEEAPITENYTSQNFGVIGRLGTLQELGLYSQNVDDSVLKTVAALPTLRKLSVSSDKITDAGIGSLAALKSLRELHLSHCAGLSPAFASSLSKFPSLKTLGLWWCGKPTDSTLADICKLTRLSNLSLAGFPDVKAQSFLALTALKQLTELSVSYSSLDDRLLAKIPTVWPRMTSLTLNDDPNITDAGTILLGSLKNLEWLSLQSCPKLTSAGADRLAKALGPNYER